MWFESAERNAAGATYSYLVWNPFWVLEWSPASGWRSRHGPGARALPEDPFEGLECVLAGLEGGGGPAVAPFEGGVAGYLAYELAARLEWLPGVARKRPLLPISRWAVGDVVFALEHRARRAWCISQGWPARGRERLARARERLDRATAAWRESLAGREGSQVGAAPRVPDAPSTAGGAFEEGVAASLDAASYRERFARLHRFLVEGDLYQANLTIAFRAFCRIDPWTAHQALLERSPAPFAALLEGEGVSVASASPELFLARRGSRLVTRPIKGTRPRDPERRRDARLARELLRSEKDRAEHVMIVDVHRNDLGRVARYGSVRVSEPWILESFATLHHLTSTVEAIPREDLRPLDPVRAAFPAGSITGAPKVRAMEILAELEPHARGAYTGAVGWIAPGGDFELSVGIRTVTLTESVAEFPAGGGIVVDSDPDAEYQEAWDKARSLWAAIRSLAGGRGEPVRRRTPPAPARVCQETGSRGS